MTSLRSIAVAALIAAGPALAASPQGPHDARPAPTRPAVAPVERLPEIPGFVLIGMAASGLVIVGVAARRRQPGRSVSS